MSGWHYLGAGLIIAVIVGVGIWSGRQVHSASDFTGKSRRAGVGMVMGALIGTLVGGASTIGTAQLAYTNGFSAWWFTLGGGIGLLLMGTVLANRLYNSGAQTIPEIITNEFGKPAGTLTAVLASVGSFLSVVAQLLAGMALITALSSALSNTVAILITLALIIVYVIFGGSLGAGYVGIAKTSILALSIGACAIIALGNAGGPAGLWQHPELPHDTFFNLVGRGFNADLGNGASLVLGVVTEQAYVQALLSGKALRSSRIGTLLAAAFVPLIGALGIIVGLSMRITHPGLPSALALPQFILDNLPGVIAGAVLATLLIAVVGTGAGLGLGIGTVLSRDLIMPRLSKTPNPPRELRLARLILLGVLAVAGVIAISAAGGLILDWSFLSMGLRGAVAFAPAMAALFLPGHIDRRFAIAAMVLGPALALGGDLLLPDSINSIWIGVCGAILTVAAGYRRHRNATPDAAPVPPGVE